MVNIHNYDLSSFLDAAELDAFFSRKIPLNSSNSYELWSQHHAFVERVISIIQDNKLQPLEQEQSLASPPAVREDRMDGIQSMVDGKIYESKSAYYKHLKEGGHHIVDYKQEHKPKTEKIDWRSAIQESMR